MSDEHQDAIAGLLRDAGARTGPSAAQYDRARAAAEAVWREEVRRGRKTRIVTASLAAAAAVILAVAWLRPSVEPGSDVPVATIASARGPVRVGIAFLEPGAVIPSGGVVRTGPGTRATLRMANGVELRLDAGSELTIAAVSRIDLAQGAVFVDTDAATDSRQSIEVRTPLGSARDIGTRFEVRLVALPSRDETLLRVRVRDGTVSLTTPRMTIDANRGVELVAAPTGEIVRTAAPTSGSEWDWITLAAAPFDIEGKTLAEFLDWAAREGGWQIRFASDALGASAAATVLSGSIEGQTPGQALLTVLPTCGLTHRINGNILTIEPGGVS
jgi:ferric-dicitrate binding protein FerR (iron transport regulator)